MTTTKKNESKYSMSTADMIRENLKKNNKNENRCNVCFFLFF